MRGKLVQHIGKVVTHPLLMGSAIVFAGSVAANIGAYLYHLFLGRAMGPKGYGEFSSLNSLIYLLMVGTIVLQTVLTRYFSACKARGESGRAHDLFVRVNSKLLVVLGIGFAVSLVAAYPVSIYLHLSSWVSVPLVYIVFAMSALVASTASYSSGYQKFVWVAGVGALAVFLRLALVVPVAHMGVDAVLASYCLAAMIAYGVSFIPVRPVLSVRRERFDTTFKGTVRASIHTFLILLVMTSLYSTDIVLVRHFFPGEQAGWYAALAVLGKIIFYASSAVGQVVLPVVSERAAKNDGSVKIVAAAVGLVAAVSLAGLAVYALFPGMIVHLLFGKSYDPVIGLLVPFGTFMVVYSLANIVVTALLALGKTTVWPAFVVIAVGQILGISLYHPTLSGVIWLNIGLTSVLFAVAVASYLTAGRDKAIPAAVPGP
jgi:O-antigen/teichoic acid export membrane protein